MAVFTWLHRSVGEGPCGIKIYICFRGAGESVAERELFHFEAFLSYPRGKILPQWWNQRNFPWGVHKHDTIYLL